MRVKAERAFDTVAAWTGWKQNVAILVIMSVVFATWGWVYLS